MFVRNGFTLALDWPEAVPVGTGECLLQGWCFATKPAGKVEIAVRVDGVESRAFLGIERPDVVEHFHNPSALRSGFLVRFRRPRNGQPAVLVCRLDGVSFPLVEEIQLPGRNKAGGSQAKASTYEDWVLRREPELFWREDEVRTRLLTLRSRPLISIILPVYNTPHYFLTRCLDSVLEQHYGNWQLCIVDDRSSDEAVFQICQNYAAKDRRIRLERSSQQSGIAAASNLALQHATGEFIILLDHDDELHRFALVEVARALNADSACQLFYSDEDKIDERGIRSQPAFKPDFDGNIFLSFNYLGHLIALKRSVAAEIGGFRPSCDGAQDWDLLIRATEVMPSSAIGHIRKPLYHWRMHDESTSRNLDAKPYAAKAWVQVLQDHLKRTAKKAKAMEGLFYGSMRIKYDAPKETEVGVFIRPADGPFQRSVLRVNAGRRTVHLYQTLGCSVIEMPSAAQATPADTLLCSLTELKGDIFVFISGPLESVNHLFFEELVAQGMRADCGLVTGLALDWQNRVLATGFVRAGEDGLVDPYIGGQFPSHGYMGQLSVVRSIDVCPGMFFAVRRDQLAKAGGLGMISSSSHMQHLASILSKNAIDQGLSVLFTPYAVATFSEGCKRPAMVEDPDQSRLASLRLNPQLLSFEQQEQMLQGKMH